MRKLEKIQIVKNVGSSWVALAVNILVGIFLSPFILHHLGDAAFGIWVLIFSLTGYYGIFDFGIRSSIIRFVSKYTATNDLREVSGLINTALFTYSCVGFLCLIITLVGSFYVDRVFHVSPGLQSTARWLLLMVGTSVGIGFPLGMFGGVLEGMQKFYVLNWTTIVSSLLRVLLIVFYLNRGYGLLTVALITVGLPFLASMVRGIVALRALPVRFSWSYVERRAFRQMANYSGLTFMIIVAAQLRFKTDAIVIGKILSSAAITYFYAGSRLVDYAGEVVSSLAQIFVPMSSQSDAAGNIEPAPENFHRWKPRVRFHSVSDGRNLHHHGKIHHRGLAGQEVRCSRVPSADHFNHSFHANADASRFVAHSVWNEQTWAIRGCGLAGRRGKSGSQHTAGASLWNTRRRCGDGHSFIAHLYFIYASLFVFTSRCPGLNLLAASLSFAAAAVRASDDLSSDYAIAACCPHLSAIDSGIVGRRRGVRDLPVVGLQQQSGFPS